MPMLALILLAMIVVGCAEKKEIKNTVFGSQIQTMERARAVEDKLKQGEEKNREALKASENQDNESEQKGSGH